MSYQTNPLRHYYLLANGWYQTDTVLHGLQAVTAFVKGIPEPTVEQTFGTVIPLVWKSLLATPEVPADAQAMTSGNSPLQAFAEMWMFLRQLAHNLDMNPDIVYNGWDEAYAQMFLSVLNARHFEHGELGEPDPKILPINKPAEKKNYGRPTRRYE
jgi:hypothetical protein